MKKELSIVVRYIAKVSLIIGIIFSFLCLTLIYIAFNNVVLEEYGDKLFPEVNDRAAIRQDSDGVLVISSKNTYDLMFAQGYASAKMRLLQMTSMRMTFQGRMSEVVGEKALKLDKYMRVLGLYRSADASYQSLDSRTQKDLQAYADGVNAYMESHKLSPEFKLLGFKPEKWRPEDSVLIQKIMAWNMSRNWTHKYSNSQVRQKYGLNEVNNLYPTNENPLSTISKDELDRSKLPRAKTSWSQRYKDPKKLTQEQLNMFDEFINLDVGIINNISNGDTRKPGSNAWAVSAIKSKSGFPLIANDPHLELKIPGTFILVNLEGPFGSISGASIPGTPYVIIGHNDTFSWGFTNSHTDQSDLLWVSKPTKKVKVFKEEIKIKNKDPVALIVKDVENGRIVSESGKNQAVLKWVGFSTKDTTLQSLYGINRSKSVNEAVRQSRDFVSPAMNTIFIDRKDIAYRLIGKIPLRKDSGRFVTTSPWKGFVKDAYNPYIVNPKKGYVANSNNSIIHPTYQYLLNALEYDDVRQFRLTELLNVDGMMSIEDQKDIQLDVKDGEWLLLKDRLLKIHPKTHLAKKAFKMLQDWDGYAHLSSVGVTIYSQWIREISRVVYDKYANDPVHHQPRYLIDHVIHVLDSNEPVGSFKNADEMLVETFEKAVIHLASHWGASVSHWKWKYVHKMTLPHVLFGKVPYVGYLFNRDRSISGSRETLNRARWFADSKWFDAREGAALRLLVDAKSFKHDQMMIVPGQSDQILSLHYDDLVSLWSKGKFFDIASTNKGKVNQIDLIHKD